MPTRAPKRGRGRPKKGTSPGAGKEMRAELVRAAIQLVRERGASAVTTTTLTKMVGISQSGFYQHFSNVDECLGAAAVSFADEMRLNLRSIRDRFFAHVELLDDAALHDSLRRAFQHTLSYALDEPRLVELIMMFKRFRGDTSPFGRALQEVDAQVIEDMVAEIMASGKRMG